MSLAFNLPINSVSFGQISTLIIRELYKSNLNASILPIGNTDLSTQSDIDQAFVNWIQQSINVSLETHNRNNRLFKLWHINGSLESYSNEQILLSFYELDQPTKAELNIIKNNYKVLFSSKETVKLFNDLGHKNVEYIPLAFDKYNFSVTNRSYFTDDRIVFNLVGKLEKRKHHLKLIKLWTKKFGNNKKYALQCCIFNHFMKPEDQNNLIYQTLEGKNYFNVNFLPFMGQNKIYNDFLNSGDIVLGMSGAEGWGLPEFHSVAMGKHAVIMDAHGYKSWANQKNSTLVNPSSKIDAYDNLFFTKGLPFNQGNIYDFNEEEFINACELAIEKVQNDKVNKEGLKLQQEFTSEKLLQNILTHFK